MMLLHYNITTFNAGEEETINVEILFTKDEKITLSNENYYKIFWK